MYYLVAWWLISVVPVKCPERPGYEEIKQCYFTEYSEHEKKFKDGMEAVKFINGSSDDCKYFKVYEKEEENQ